MFAKIFIIAILALSGGTSVAAESALPGDIFYPVKTEVNERIRAAITPTAEGKATWEARVAQRRIEEAVELAAEGNLSEEQLVRIESRLKTHIDRVEQRAEKLEEKGKLEAAARVRAHVDSSLATHVRLLERLDTKGDVKVREQLEVELDEIQKDRKENRRKLRTSLGDSTEANMEMNIKRLRASLHVTEVHLKNVARMSTQHETKLNEAVKAKIQTELELAATLLEKAQTSIDDENIQAGTAAQEEARIHISEAEALLKGAIRFHIPGLLNIEIRKNNLNDTEDSQRESTTSSEQTNTSSDVRKNDQKRKNIQTETEGDVDVDLDDDLNGNAQVEVTTTLTL